MILDCAVVGAGPAGCAAAIELARAGARVALLDRARFPRRKACGEGLMPQGVEALRALGVLEAARSLGRPLQGVRYHSRSGRCALGRFRAGPGLGVPREDLDWLLLRRAAAAGVEVLQGAAVTRVELGAMSAALFGPSGFLRAARRLILADGLASPALRSLGVRRLPASRPRVGVSVRLEGVAALSGFVEVFLAPGGELYLTPLGPSRGGMALLCDLGSLPSGLEGAWRGAAAACPELRERLAAARVEAPPVALGPLGGCAAAVEGRLWWAAGDAAGAVDPLVGDGVALGLAAGRLAAEEALSSLSGRGRRGRYAAARRRLLLGRRVKAAALLALGRRPVLAEAALAGLRRFPWLFERLLD